MVDNFRVALGLNSGEPLFLVLGKPIIIIVFGLLFARKEDRSLSYFHWRLGEAALIIGGAPFLSTWPLLFFRGDAAASAKESPPPVLNGRIVVAVFDELDVEYGIEKFPRGLGQHGFTALAKESLFFTNAQRPGHETLVSMPALIDGKKYARAEAQASGYELTLWKPNTFPAVSWTKEPKILSQEGLNVPFAITGWYHPYERIMSGAAPMRPRVPDEFFTAFGMWIHFTFEHTLSLVKLKWTNPLYANRMAAYQKQVTTEVKESALELLDGKSEVTVIHFPAPHGPFVMVPNTNDPNGLQPDSYYSNVHYAGSVLNLFRKRLDNAKLPYVLIVTSDHNWREPPPGSPVNTRVPLMIYAPGIKPARIDQPAEAVNIAHLVKAMVEERKTAPNGPFRIDTEQITKILTQPAK